MQHQYLNETTTIHILCPLNTKNFAVLAIYTEIKFLCYTHTQRIREALWIYKNAAST